MAIRYEIDVNLISSDGAQLPPALFKQTVDELDREFGLVTTTSIYRPVLEGSNRDAHNEWVRFSFDAPETSATHDAVARWFVTIGSDNPDFDGQLLEEITLNSPLPFSAPPSDRPKYRIKSRLFPQEIEHSAPTKE